MLSTDPRPRRSALLTRARRLLRTYGTVLVSGPSMEPTLRDGDCLLVRYGGRATAGDVVVARFHDRPDLLVVKRAATALPDGWMLVSDNAGAPGAARGPGRVEAVAVARWWPLPPRRTR